VAIVAGLQNDLHAEGKVLADAIAKRDGQIVSRDKRLADNGY